MMKSICDKTLTMYSLRTWLLLSGFATILASSGFGQTSTATIFGTITDSSGSALTAARVTPILGETGAREIVNANERGDYIFPSLRPGTYSVEVEAQGFKKAQAKGVLIEVNQRARQDFAM